MHFFSFGRAMMKYAAQDHILKANNSLTETAVQASHPFASYLSLSLPHHLNYPNHLTRHCQQHSTIRKDIKLRLFRQVKKLLNDKLFYS